MPFRPASVLRNLYIGLQRHIYIYIFLKVLGEVTPLALKNNLRIILGSKSEKFENIAAWKKLCAHFLYESGLQESRTQ